MAEREVHLRLPRPHPAQAEVIAGSRRFNVLCAGRRFGKTKLGLDRCIKPLLDGSPCAFFSPTYKNLSATWREAVELLKGLTVAKAEDEHRLQLASGGILEMWSLEGASADTVRGRRYALAIIDEAAQVGHLLDAWQYIIRPCLVDLAGGAWFISTPRGRDDFYGLYERGQSQAAKYDDWASWRYPSAANPHLPPAEIAAMRAELTLRAFEQEIEARFIDEVAGALWKQADIEAARLEEAPPLRRIVVAIDPAITSDPASDASGIVACGVGRGRPLQGYVLSDATGHFSPDGWARRAINLYRELRADSIVAEANQGGEMVRHTLATVDAAVPVRLVHASRGKQTRAEPIAALFEQHRVHLVGRLDSLERQLVSWSPADDEHSPDALDAMVWGLSELMLTAQLPEYPAADFLAATNNDLEYFARKEREGR